MRLNSVWGRLLLFIFIGSLLRFWKLFSGMTFYSDLSWFYLLSRDSVLHGSFPMVTIGASISWLHQGAVWVYLLIPALILSGFNPVGGAVLTALMGIVSIPLIYYLAVLISDKKTALISAFLLSCFFLPVVLSRLAYHNSPIILFFLVFALCLVKKMGFVSGLFLGWLYQLHLLSIILWPFAYFYLFRHRLSPWKFSAGLFISVLPFIIVGPLQTFGVLLWLARFLIHIKPVPAGFISISYLAIILVPAVILAAKFLSFLSGKILFVLGLAFLMVNSFYLFSQNFLPPVLVGRHELSDQISQTRQILVNSRISNPEIRVAGGIAGITDYNASYLYLIWWLNRLGVGPSGTHTVFQVNDSGTRVSVIE